MLVLADGMGGHRGGAWAAQRVIDTCEKAWQESGGAPGDTAEFLDKLVDRAHGAVNELRQEKGVDARSTMVVALVRGAQANWVHSGDSRIYLIKQQQISERTRDHSLVEALLAGGHISAEEARVHPDRSKLLTSIGGDDPPKRAVSGADLAPGDGLCLASDGVWEHLEDSEIVQAIASDDLSAALSQCLEVATSRGADKADNASMALVRRLPAG
jgi:serine/threonine protein phosphatase PrpC